RGRSARRTTRAAPASGPCGRTKWGSDPRRPAGRRAAVRRSSGFSLLFGRRRQRFHLLLELAQVAPHVGQTVQCREDAQRLALRPSGVAMDALVGLEVAADAGAGADHGAVADVDMVSDADATGHHDVVARGARPRDADQAAQQVVLADLAVVADLHEVVDLGARADAGRLEG